MNDKYKTLHGNLEKACQSLGWKFEGNPDVVNRFDIEDGIGFTIDGCEYFVSTTQEASPFNARLIQNIYYAAGIVQHRGSRFEPPSEDEAPLTGENTYSPESLVSRILSAHSSLRLEWAMESLIPDYDPIEGE